MSLISPPLLAFMAVCDCHTVHAAAAQLHLTQTAVTQRIKNLEQKLATTLFIRTKKGMNLTTEGIHLLRYCKGVEQMSGETLAQIQSAGQESIYTLTITAPTSIMNSRIAPAMTNVFTDFSRLYVQFDTDDSIHRINKLRLGQSDIVITDPQFIDRELKSKKLSPENYQLVCAKSWANRRLRNIIKSERIVDFSPDDDMTFNYLRQYELYEHAQHERMFANRTELLAKLIASEQGYSVLTNEFIKPYIKNNELHVLNGGKIMLHDTSMAWYDRPNMPPYFQAIIDAIT